MSNLDILKECMAEVVKIISPQTINQSSMVSKSPFQTRNIPSLFDNEVENADEMLPSSALSRGNGKFLHFFETGSNKLHLVNV